MSDGFSKLSNKSTQEGGAADFDVIDALRARHPARKLLRAGNAGLTLSFLGVFFVDANRGACAASDVASALDDHVHALNTAIATDETCSGWLSGGRMSMWPMKSVV